MISSLHGTVLHIGPDVVEVSVGGVGFTVAVTPALARSARLGEPLLLHTVLIVREDLLSLYGFAGRAECALFSLLLSVTGVGPKSALGVLAALSVDQVAQAVGDGDDAPFRRVSGIGAKTAKLIIVQLAGKLAPPATAPAGGAAADGALGAQVVAALVGLGWSERLAAEVVEQVAADTADSAASTVPVLLRRALAQLGPARPEAVRG